VQAAARSTIGLKESRQRCAAREPTKALLQGGVHLLPGFAGRTTHDKLRRGPRPVAGSPVVGVRPARTWAMVRGGGRLTGATSWLWDAGHHLCRRGTRFRQPHERVLPMRRLLLSTSTRAPQTQRHVQRISAAICATGKPCSGWRWPSASIAARSPTLTCSYLSACCRCADFQPPQGTNRLAGVAAQPRANRNGAKVTN
jgi:hypothetical protein